STYDINTLTELTPTSDHDIETISNWLSTCNTKISKTNYFTQDKKVDNHENLIENETLLQNNTKIMTTKVLPNLAC
ncbi:unnamed protein product, partial [Didymodactylos carnosus]